MIAFLGLLRVKLRFVIKPEFGIEESDAHPAPKLEPVAISWVQFPGTASPLFVSKSAQSWTLETFAHTLCHWHLTVCCRWPLIAASFTVSDTTASLSTRHPFAHGCCCCWVQPCAHQLRSIGWEHPPWTGSMQNIPILLVALNIFNSPTIWDGCLIDSYFLRWTFLPPTATLPADLLQ